MAKQFIIAAMEEVLGEYILNMSKENMKIAAVRGQIKLDNVHLDGDLIGSHVLGAVGLSGFGVLSCWAKSVLISIPWKRLEIEPTKVEIRGIHLVCVPLTAASAHQMYGCGTIVDPRCSLRTRAKRLVLARMERNYWNGQIAGEGPPMKRVTRAMQDIERDWRKQRKKRKAKKDSGDAEESGFEEVIDNLVNDISETDSSFFSESEDRSSQQQQSLDSSFTVDNLPELPQDWKHKLRDKVSRNLEASMHDVHIRCEVAENGLGVAREFRASNSSTAAGGKSPAERAFSFGVTVESMVVRTANSQWEVGSHDKRDIDGSGMTSAKGHLGPNEYVVKNNKILYFNNVSVYWDDDPALLLAETDLLRGNFRKVKDEKLHSKIAQAMVSLRTKQEPGKKVRDVLYVPVPEGMDESRQHQFVCKGLAGEVRGRASERTLPGPISCSADVLPFDITFSFRPHQYVQYNQLKVAISSQLRFDTMLRQRPSESPLESPRAWWKYIIECVTSRPNSRPWKDVQRICSKRARYIDLVVKKNLTTTDTNGYHAGLNEKESAELLKLEDLLPVEALSAFHLVALRRAYRKQRSDDSSGQDGELTPRKKKSGRFRLLRGSNRKSAKSGTVKSELEVPLIPLHPREKDGATKRRSQNNRSEANPLDETGSSRTISLFEAVTMKLGKKTWYVDWKLHCLELNVLLFGSSGEEPVAQLVAQTSGSARSFGKEKRDFFFDIARFDAFHRGNEILYVRAADSSGVVEESEGVDLNSPHTSDAISGMSVKTWRKLGAESGAPDLNTPSRYLELPPSGVACRVLAGKSHGRQSISLSSHPATLVWTSSLLSGLSDYFPELPVGIQTDISQHIRDAATPLARKAQLALLSPGAVSLHLNISAPKVWIPMVSRETQGALFLDAGSLKMSGYKEGGGADMNLNTLARDIQVKFVRGRTLTSLGSNAHMQLLSHLTETSIGRSESSVVYPFNIIVEATNQIYDPESAGSAQAPENEFLSGTVRNVGLTLTPVCLNLVDAEVLARSFGKWYSRGISKARTRSATTANAKLSKESLREKNGYQTLQVASMPQVLSFNLEKLEMALEGHSKRPIHHSDDKSLMSLDSFHELSPQTRTYLVQVSDIGVKRSRKDQRAVTRFSVKDASIVRLKDGAQYTPFKNRRDMAETQHILLVRSGEPGRRMARSHILSASLVHDGVAHLDEVEVDIDSTTLRVTPTTLKDCAKASRKIAELAQLLTKEMERKIHEEGRKARKRGGTRTDWKDSDKDSLLLSLSTGLSSDRDRPVSPVLSEAFTDVTSSLEPQSSRAPQDSSILFRVTLRESTLLVGRPIGDIKQSQSRPGEQTSFAVLQVLSNALIMFQSVENPDASGRKTLHVSVENLSSLVTTAFERVDPLEAPPMIGPTGAEFRVVYTTQNLGCVVSQDVSLDCDTVKACLTPSDLTIMMSVSRKMIDRLRSAGLSPQAPGDDTARKNPGNRFFIPVNKYQKRGSGIATSIRTEVQEFSFVLLRTYKSYFGAPEFLDFSVQEMKGSLEGCVSALSGEYAAVVAVNFFNSEVADWEYAIEPTVLELAVDQMPNELVLHLSPQDPIQFNLTGILLRDLSELNFDISRHRAETEGGNGEVLSSSALSTVGLRRATEVRSVSVSNFCGCDVFVSPENGERSGRIQSLRIKNGSCCNLNGGLDIERALDLGFCLTFADDEMNQMGARRPVSGLRVGSATGSRISLCHLNTFNSGRDSQPKQPIDGRSSPESAAFSEAHANSVAYHAEPVVEWCMQNQRLRSGVQDVYSIRKGKDLLSSTVWSPEDTAQDANQSHRAATSHNSSTKAPTSNWLRPFLSNDAPEWTDMTCSLQMARDRVMLPDNNWVWANNWTVDIWGEVGDTIDTDGWEYEEDFENFSSRPRYYRRGDTCRRRRWTRTRIMKPPRLDDPARHLQFVWETTIDANGNYSVTVRSPLRIRNTTALPLTFYVFSPSWDGDKLIGTAPPGSWLHVPLIYSTAVYLRLAKSSPSQQVLPFSDSAVTDRIMIMPTSHTSTKHVRTTMDLRDVSHTLLHFLVELKCDKGIMDVVVQPVLRLVNQLPCQIECQMGEVLHAGDKRLPDKKRTTGKKRSKITTTEQLQITSGGNSSCTAINPLLNPHISIRIPGYKWSSWYRIVNRKTNSEAWRPTDGENHLHYAPKGDADFADEFKCVVEFERITKSGDPLLLILSVECGHCPTLRLYAQYWILDKTGFGCRFTDGFQDLLGAVPETETSRRSYLQPEEAKDPKLKADTTVPGHQWCIGMSGMSLFFSKREKLALSIETGAEAHGSANPALRSKWVSPMDISNVMPKTVFSVDEMSGPRRFELAISVTLCPGIFGRSKLVTLFPRYQVVNLLRRELVIAQDGCMDSELIVPSQSAVPFHWEKGNLPPKVRIGAPSVEQRDAHDFSECWTNGRFRLDRVGITSLRIPTDNDLGKTPMVLQAEVRLATKDQSSAVVVVIWSATEKSNPLYLLRNTTQHTILCRQPLQDEDNSDSNNAGDSHERVFNSDGCSGSNLVRTGFHCGAEIGPMIRYFLELEHIEEFVWILKPGEVVCFGFDDPEKTHILEWTCVERGSPSFPEKCRKAVLEVNAMGSSSVLTLSNGRRVRCHIGAEHSTKVIEFMNFGTVTFADTVADAQTLSLLKRQGMVYESMMNSPAKKNEPSVLMIDEEEEAAFSLRIELPGFGISVVDNVNPKAHGREILFMTFNDLFLSFSQTREGYHEFEARLMSLQIDNHVKNSIHHVLLFCPGVDQTEPLLHMSAVRRLQSHSNTFVFRYAAIRLLEVEIYLDRRTAEAMAEFVKPVTHREVEENQEATDWVLNITEKMASKFSTPDRRAPRDLEQLVHTANSGRIYFEQLHLHPIRIALSFSQEWMEWNPGTETVMIFQFIRGMASIANAPLTFTSFVVGHVFEAPQELLRVVAMHYSSQLTKQVVGLLGSLAILGAPADFISNVGTGVRDFFYEPINGAVHGPKQFLEGLETGTQSLARGVFVGVVRGAANVTEVVNGNLAGLTADDDFIDERRAHQRMLTDAMSRGLKNRTFGDSLYLAGASVARGLKSGAFGIVEQPSLYASKHGPVGFLKGVGKAVVGAVFKPVVGVGDAAVLVMNHMSDMTSDREVLPKIPKRLRRALACRSTDKPNCVRLQPYDERAAKAQKIVTASESIDDVYIGHINIPSHLIIASSHFLWAIDRRSRDPWCVNWEEVSHFSQIDGGVRVVVFSQTGLKTYVFHVEEGSETEFCDLLSMQLRKMGNSSDLNSTLLNSDPDNVSRQQIPGLKARQVNHVFGSFNNSKQKASTLAGDEADLVEQAYARVNSLGSESSSFLKKLDEEAWRMVYSWGQMFSGLSSRRCVVAGIINGTERILQIKSYKLVEGGSPCYSIPSREFDSEQGILHAGGCVMFFGWGAVPNLSHPGSILMSVETNAFICELGSESRPNSAEATPGYRVGFLEKSFDESGWWAKYWLLVREANVISRPTTREGQHFGLIS